MINSQQQISYNKFLIIHSNKKKQHLLFSNKIPLEIGFHLSFSDAIQHEYSQCYAASNHQYIYPQRIKNISDKLTDEINDTCKNKLLVFHCGYVNRQDSQRNDVLEKSENDSFSLILIAKSVQKKFLQFNPTHKTLILFHVYKLSQLIQSKKILQSFNKNVSCKGLSIVFEQTSQISLQDFLQFKQQMNCNICIDTAHLWANGITIEQFLQLNIKDISLIHLNGNQLNINTHHDKHCDVASPEDKVFTKETLKQFVKKYSSVPMICERKEEVYEQQYINKINNLLQ